MGPAEPEGDLADPSTPARPDHRPSPDRSHGIRTRTELDGSRQDRGTTRETRMSRPQRGVTGSRRGRPRPPPDRRRTRHVIPSFVGSQVEDAPEAPSPVGRAGDVVRFTQPTGTGFQGGEPAHVGGDSTSNPLTARAPSPVRPDAGAGGGDASGALCRRARDLPAQPAPFPADRGTP